MRKRILIILPILALVAAACFFVYLKMFPSDQTPRKHMQISPLKGERYGSLRSAPYPYKSMLSICSDIDGTTLREFEIYHKFINTDQETGWGKGLSLDVADSLFMYTMNDNGEVHDGEGSGQDFVMSYYKNDKYEFKCSDAIVEYSQKGWIDSMHTFGDFSQVDDTKPVYKAEYGEKAFAEMKKRGFFPTVWINHGNAANVDSFRDPSRTSEKFDYQQGANPDSEYYHANYTVPGGIKFVWFSQPSSYFGLDSPLYPVALEDGQKVWGFQRYTSRKTLFGMEYNWSIYSLAEQLSKKNLDSLVNSGKIAIVAQHLGGAAEQFPLTNDSAEALRLLSEYEKRGDIMVTRTSRALEFIRVRDNLDYTYEKTESGEVIKINKIADSVLGEKIPTEDDLKGIMFNVENAETAKIFIGGKEAMTELVREKAEKSDVIGFKWYEK